jgi:hypothetical protein
VLSCAPFALAVRSHARRRASSEGRNAPCPESALGPPALSRLAYHCPVVPSNRVEPTLFQSVLDDPAGYIAGGGKDNQLYLGAFLDFLLVIGAPYGRGRPGVVGVGV